MRWQGRGLRADLQGLLRNARQRLGDQLVPLRGERAGISSPLPGSSAPTWPSARPAWHLSLGRQHRAGVPQVVEAQVGTAGGLLPGRVEPPVQRRLGRQVAPVLRREQQGMPARSRTWVARCNWQGPVTRCGGRGRPRHGSTGIALRRRHQRSRPRSAPPPAPRGWCPCPGRGRSTRSWHGAARSAPRTAA